MEATRWGGAKVVMTVLRGRVVVEEPEEADFEPDLEVAPDLELFRVGMPGEGGGSGSVLVGFSGSALGMRRAVRPPPGRYVFNGAVSCRQGLRSQFSGAEWS